MFSNTSILQIPPTCSYLQGHPNIWSIPQHPLGPASRSSPKPPPGTLTQPFLRTLSVPQACPCCLLSRDFAFLPWTGSVLLVSQDCSNSQTPAHSGLTLVGINRQRAGFHTTSPLGFGERLCSHLPHSRTQADKPLPSRVLPGIMVGGRERGISSPQASTQNAPCHFCSHITGQSHHRATPKLGGEERWREESVIL